LLGVSKVSRPAGAVSAVRAAFRAGGTLSSGFGLAKL
jgi:hypothetical protein